MDAGLVEESRRFEEAIKAFQLSKIEAEKAEDMKSRLILEKLEENDAKTHAQQEMLAYVGKFEEYQKEFAQSIDAVQNDLLKLGKDRQDLMGKLKQYQAKLEAKRADSIKLRQKFKIYVQIPDMEVKFRGQSEEQREDDSRPISGVFAISQRPTVLLLGGQALVTFEEERVASQILKIAKCSVFCDNISTDVKPKRITIDPAVKFEVHLDVSRKELKVYDVPSSMQEERMKDRLEMSFSRPSRGGGEVKRVEYNISTGTGQITFLHSGVPDSLVLRGRYCLDLDSGVDVLVGPIYNYQLRKFQTFCGSPKRTILLDDIEDMEDEEDMQDHLEIHFQKPSNYGGEIESVKYISRGKVLRAFFLCESKVEIDV